VRFLRKVKDWKKVFMIGCLGRSVLVLEGVNGGSGDAMVEDKKR
jgi:hypothetical protein